MVPNTDKYRKRFLPVLEHIDTHLCDSLAAEKLAQIGCFSKYHFQRLFFTFFGLSSFKYVQIKRIEHAGKLLAYRSHLTVTEIALRCGFDTPESFARTFKKQLLQTPTEFRKKPNWDTFNALIFTLNRTNMIQTTEKAHTYLVEIIHFEAVQIAAIEHHGSAKLIGQTLQKFIQWRRENQLPPTLSKTYNLIYNDPNQVPEDQFRMDICASINRSVPENEAGIVNKLIPAGRCAKVRHKGSETALAQVIDYLYRSWLPQSDELLRDFPCFLHRVTLFSEDSQEPPIVDVYLPLQ